MPTAPYSSAPTSPPTSPPSKQSFGLYASLARLVAPLFLPFRRQLGVDVIATANYLTNNAITASLADPRALQYSLTPSPVTGVAPLTVLHMWLLHSRLIQHIHAATVPDSPSRPSLERWQAIHKACLEGWWNFIADATAPVVGGLMLNKTMMSTQTQVLGLFQALDLAVADGDVARRRQLLRSVLYRNLYGDGTGESAGKKLEVQRLAEWAEAEWGRLRVKRVEGVDSATDVPSLVARQLPELKAEDREEAERTVQLVEYELKEGKLVIASATQ